MWQQVDPEDIEQRIPDDTIQIWEYADTGFFIGIRRYGNSRRGMTYTIVLPHHAGGSMPSSESKKEIENWVETYKSKINDWERVPDRESEDKPRFWRHKEQDAKLVIYKRGVNDYDIAVKSDKYKVDSWLAKDAHEEANNTLDATIQDVYNMMGRADFRSKQPLGDIRLLVNL